MAKIDFAPEIQFTPDIQFTPERPTTIGGALKEHPFIAPGAATRAGIRAAFGGESPIEAAQNALFQPEKIPTFQQQALERFAPKTRSVLLNFLGGLPASTAGLAADIVTDPVNLALIAATGGIARIPVGAGRTVGQAIGAVGRAPFGRGFIAAARAGFRNPTPIVSKAAGAVKQVLPKRTAQVVDDTIRTPDALSKITNIVNAQQQMQTVGTALPKGLKVQTQLVDRFAPIRHFQNMAEKVSGKSIQFDQRPFEAARLFAGIGGKIKNRVEILGDIIRPQRGHLQQLKELMTAQRLLERANRGFRNPRGISRKTVQKSLVQLRNQLGDDSFNALRGTASRIRRELFDFLLQETKDSGVISQEAFNVIRAKNQFYVPFDVLDFMSKNLDRLPVGTKSFNSATQSIIKPIKGTIRDIADPIDAMIRKVFNVVNTNERNKVAQKLINLRKFDSRVAEWIKPLKSGQKPAAGFERFSAFFDGIKRDFSIPQNVAEAVKGLSTENMDFITRFATLGSRALRAGATQLNLPFTVPNVIRDFQTAKLVSKVGFNLRDWVKGFASVLKKDNMFKLYNESGAGFSGFFTRFRRTTPTGVRELAPSLSRKVITGLNPFKWITKIAETSELSTRVGVFQRGLRKGLRVPEAAFNSRNATIDFAKMGTKMKLANMWVPFLNARLQGTLNVFKAVKQNPTRTAWLASSMVAAPLAATYVWNTKFFPDVWDDISQFEKDRNFIFIFGRDKDEDKKWLNVAKIPKGDFGRLFGNPLENFLEWMRGTQQKDFQELALETLSDLSPVGFEREGKFSAGVLASGLLPPPAKAVAETVTGVNLFTGRPIVPRRLEGVSPREEFTTKTPKLLVKLGQATGVSPLKLQNALGTLFGGLGRELPALVSGEFGRGLGVPRRFAGAFGGGATEELFDIADEVSRASRDKKVIAKRNALRILEQVQKLPVEQRQDFLRTEFVGKLDDFRAFMDLIRKDTGDEPIDRFVRALPTEARAKYLLQVIQRFDTQDQKIQFLLDMRRKKILSDSVIRELAK